MRKVKDWLKYGVQGQLLFVWQMEGSPEHSAVTFCSGSCAARGFH